MSNTHHIPTDEEIRAMIAEADANPYFTDIDVAAEERRMFNAERKG